MLKKKFNQAGLALTKILHPTQPCHCSARGQDSGTGALIVFNIGGRYSFSKVDFLKKVDLLGKYLT